MNNFNQPGNGLNYGTNPTQPTGGSQPWYMAPWTLPMQNQNVQTTPVNTPQQTFNWNRPIQPQPQTYNILSGRIIANPQEIRPNEVSMDGSLSLFPMNDGSCIYVKSWGADGNIQTIKFIPDPQNSQQSQGPSEFDQMMDRLTSIEASIESLRNMGTTVSTEAQQNTIKKQSYQRKEVNNNGN